MTNRILVYLGGTCRCSRARHVVSQWETVADEIESADPELLRCCTTPVSDVMDGGEGGIETWLKLALSPVYDLETATSDVAYDLRVLAGRMLSAADRLDGEGVHHE